MKWIQKISSIGKIEVLAVYSFGIINTIYYGLYSPFSFMMIYLTIKLLWFVYVNIKLSKNQVLIGKRKDNSLFTSVYFVILIILVQVVMHIMEIDDLLVISIVVIIAWNFILFLIMWTNEIYVDSNEQLTTDYNCYTMIGYKIEDESKYNKLIIFTNKLFIKFNNLYIISLITCIEVIIYLILFSIF